MKEPIFSVEDRVYIEVVDRSDTQNAGIVKYHERGTISRIADSNDGIATLYNVRMEDGQQIIVAVAKSSD